MKSPRKLTRREFIHLSALAGVSLAAACTPAATATKAPDATKAPEATKGSAATQLPAATKPAATSAPVAAKFHEAPMLAELVKANKLPAVEKRLPDTPMVMAGVESQVGNYGGSMRRAFKGTSDRWGPTKMVDRGVVWFDKNLNLVPRLCESWKSNDTATEFTINLRKGTKWSDGQPFTSADVQWWYDHVLTNKVLTAAIGSPWVTGTAKTVVKLATPDANTVKFTFADPNPLFIFVIVRQAFYLPGHYMAQYHIDTTKDKEALNAATKAAGFSSWDQYYTDRSQWYTNIELPFLGPWVAKSEISKELFLMERNPYFFAVDANGNQLPYIDSVRHRIFQTNDVYELWLTSGEIDFQARHIQSSSYTLLKSNEAKGDYKLVMGVSGWSTGVQLNMGCKNKKLREVFNDRQVRIALNLAIDRPTINELIYNGLYTPSQYAPIKASPHYYEKASNANINFDVAKANKLLDDAGYTKKDSDGIRLFKDGSGPISFIIESFSMSGPSDADCVIQIAKMWKEVGIKATFKNIERSLYEQHQTANEHEAAFYGDARSILPLVSGAISWRGVATDRYWSGAYGIWKVDPSNPNAEEPPKDHFLWKIWEIWDKIIVEGDPVKRNQLFTQILDIWVEEMPQVGLFMEQPQIAVVKNGFKNFVKGWPYDDTTGDEHVYQTEMYYWDDPSKHMA